VSVGFSIFAVVVGFIGLLGGFITKDPTFYSNIITFIIGIWVPSPTLKKDRDSENTTDPSEVVRFKSPHVERLAALRKRQFVAKIEDVPETETVINI
jgi:hypothetical protein